MFNKFVLTRADIYMGILKKRNITDIFKRNARGILYTEAYDLAVDLIYNVHSPCYPFASTPDSDFYVEHGANLDHILEFMGYGKEVTKRDLYKIQKDLIMNDYFYQKHLVEFYNKDIDDAPVHNLLDRMTYLNFSYKPLEGEIIGKPSKRIYK